MDKRHTYSREDLELAARAGLDHDFAPDRGQDAESVASQGDQIDRRGFLRCMAWTGGGLVWAISGGVLSSCTFAQAALGQKSEADFSFVQVSDSHIGFKNVPNLDVAGTFQQALDKIKALPTPPAFVVHTGDLSHLSKSDEFDTVDQLLKGAKLGEAYFTPGEHDTFVDNGQQYLQRFGRGAAGNGWRSFDYKGVHLVGLVNVWNLRAGGFGVLGQEQLDWLKRDLEAVRDSTPIVVYAHVPLWAVYPTWGWGTADAEQALTLLRRFGSVTVLNGHIHQILQKVEGNVTFHTAASTAFPQPAPGSAPAPGPLRVQADQLTSSLGVRAVTFRPSGGAPVVVDTQIA
jgi:3',5'-cyclic-AMP phosphodiesterase